MIEYFTGVFTQFPVVYVIPVGLAAWHSGRWQALAMAVVIPLAHLAFTVKPGMSSADLAELMAITAFRGAMILSVAIWFAPLSAHEREPYRAAQTLRSDERKTSGT